MLTLPHPPYRPNWRNPLKRRLSHWSLPLAMVASLLTTPHAHAALTANADGTVTDSTTGLVWDQCTYGLTGATCASGSAFYDDWVSALAQASAANTAVYKGFTDWRVPNKNELESIVKLDVYGPAIDATVFPNTPNSNFFWTSTTYAIRPANAWVVTFDNGDTFPGLKTYDVFFVRLVRSGQSFSSFDSLLPVVNGSCGSAHATTPLVTSAPSAGLCGVGSTPGTVSTGNSAYTWNCTGSNGGTTASCSASRGYTVTPSVGAGAGNGSISPSTAQVVAYNATPTFTVAPSGGYTASVGGTCGGALSGTTYTTGAVTADCAVTASFTANPTTVYTAPSPGGGGNITTQLAGGGASCGLQSAGYQAAAAVGGTPPAGVAFPHGVVNFTTTNSCTPSGTITVTLTYPSALPAGTHFYKYGPATAGAAPTWYVHPATIAGNTITYSVTDNGQGDSNATAGVITDPGGPGVGGVAGAGVTGVPTLSGWAMLALSALMALVAFVTFRKQAV